MPITIDNIFAQCGYPQASPDEVASWNNVNFGVSFTGEVKLGLFGYDISCLASFCAGIDNEDTTWSCNLIQARGLDGLAFGGSWSAET
jgi:hypothetical protein